MFSCGADCLERSSKSLVAIASSVETKFGAPCHVQQVPAALEDDDWKPGVGSIVVRTNEVEEASAEDAKFLPSVRKAGATSDRLVFFRPVDNSMAHLTFLGQNFQRRFDFVAQVFSVSVTKRDSRNKICSVEIGGPHGPPRAVQLSDIKYATLSTLLHVWELGDNDYQVTQDLCLVWSGLSQGVLMFSAHSHHSRFAFHLGHGPVALQTSCEKWPCLELSVPSGLFF